MGIYDNNRSRREVSREFYEIVCASWDFDARQTLAETWDHDFRRLDRKIQLEERYGIGDDDE